MQEIDQTSDKIVRQPAGYLSKATQVIYLEPVDSDAVGEGGQPRLLEYWQVIRRRLAWIAVTALLGCLIGIGWSRREKAFFQAHVTLEIENPSENALSPRAGDVQGGEGFSPESYLPTQILILQSRTLRKQAGAKVDSRDFPAVVKIRVEPNSRIVQVICESTDRRFAADYANAIAKEYIESDQQAHWDALKRTREWLAHQLEETRAKLQKSENDLQQYGRASNLIFNGSKESAEQDKLKQIEEQLASAQADRVQKQSAYQMALSSPADTLPQVIDNPRLSDYMGQMAILRKQMAELIPQFTPEHYRVKRLQAQIDEMQASFHKERGNILARIRNEYQGGLMRESLLNAAYRKQAQVVSEQTQKAINYSILERDVDTNRQLYASLLQKSKEADATAMRGSNVRIIDPAEPPDTPYKPNSRNNTLLGALSGLLAGIALVLLRDNLDRSFKAPGDVSSHLKLPELGVIPAGNMISGNGHRKPWRAPLFPSIEPEWQVTGNIELATWRDKSSIIAESFRGALTSILCGPQGTRPRVIVVTSATHGEGKTTVVSNLGIALAEINQRVLLIDGDMRKPRLNSVFNVPNEWGLSDVLREKSSLRDCPLEALVKRTEMPELALMTSGPGTNSISSLLYSKRMQELLQRLRSEFDTILIDTPPMLDTSDARILGRLADAAILVFRAERTSRDAALAAKHRMADDGVPLLGTILNAWDFKHVSGYGVAHHYYQPS